MTARTPEHDDAPGAENTASREARRILTVTEAPAPKGSHWRASYDAWRTAGVPWQTPRHPTPAPDDTAGDEDTPSVRPAPPATGAVPGETTHDRDEPSMRPVSRTAGAASDEPGDRNAPGVRSAAPTTGPAPGDAARERAVPSDAVSGEAARHRDVPGGQAVSRAVGAVSGDGVRAQEVTRGRAVPGDAAPGEVARGRDVPGGRAVSRVAGAAPGGAARAQEVARERDVPGGRAGSGGAGSGGVASGGVARGRGWPVVAGGVVVGVVAAVGVAVFAWKPAPAPRPGADAALPGGRFFLPAPGGSDGLAQELGAVAAAGPVIVAAGAESEPGAAGGARAQFIVSDDDGGRWRLASVRTPDDNEPPRGARPAVVAGTRDSWVALGRDAAGASVVWTSPDARTWTYRTGGPPGRVTGLARTAAGFVAVGAAGNRAAVWTSPDGRAWERTAAPSARELHQVAVSGGVLLARGTPARVTGKRAPSGVWRSADGGRRWQAVPVPQPRGAPGPVQGIASGPGGFAAVRDDARTTGPKKRRTTTRFGTVATSPDGRVWTPAPGLGTEPHGIVVRLAGSPAGLAAVVRGKDGGLRTLRSADGRAWTPGTAIPAVTALAVAGAGTPVVAGRTGDDPLLVAGAPVDLTRVGGAIGVQRRVAAVAAAPGRLVAVGATGGDAAVWTSATPTGWTRAGTALPPGRRALGAVAHGPSGWLALGAESSGKAVALASPDGVTWRPVPAPGRATSVAAGPRGYVAVGPGGVWHSADLTSWRRANLGTGTGAAPRAVTATPAGYAAVGGLSGKGIEMPGAWTSPDGVAWKPTRQPPGTAPPTAVAAHGARLLALVPGGALLSPDGGTTWTPQHLNVLRDPAAVTATPAGFAAAGATGVPGARTLTVVAERGGAWERLPARGADGDQRVDALAADGGALLVIGTTMSHRGDVPYLWRTMAP